MDAPFVQGSDFNSMKVSIGLTVTAKRAGIHALKADDEPRLVELRDDGITLDLPEGVCLSGDRVLVQLQVKTPEGQRATFSAPAQVEGLDPPKEGAPQNRVAVILRFLLAASADWATFRRVFDSRQREIDDFMKAAKGY